MSDSPAVPYVAIAGSLPTKADNPAVAITVAEQVDRTQVAFQTSATIARRHVRDDAGRSTSNPERFAIEVPAVVARHVAQRLEELD